MTCLLLNENVPLVSCRYLQQAVQDVTSATDIMPGATDRAVLSLALQEQRVVVTFDRDYGELVYARQLPAYGVLYLRLEPVSPVEPAEIILKLLANPAIRLEHRFTVADCSYVRQRPLGRQGDFPEYQP